jgi:5-methylthioadenosine/S-adenosylhomocysteine deaminase
MSRMLEEIRQQPDALERTLASELRRIELFNLRVAKRRPRPIVLEVKLVSGVAPVTRVLALDMAVGLGPDGPAGSNNDFNMFEEMDLAAKLQEITTGDPRSLPAEAAVEMATIRGARALGMEKEIGSLESSKRADVISIRLDRPNAVPMYNVYSQMVYALKGSDVEDVMVNGKLVVKDAQALTLDAAQIEARAREYREQVQKSLR